MPKVRLLGNIGLSFLTKLSTGYWELFDPTNGFLAIHQDVFKKYHLIKQIIVIFLKLIFFLGAHYLMLLLMKLLYRLFIKMKNQG